MPQGEIECVEGETQRQVRPQQIGQTMPARHGAAMQKIHEIRREAADNHGREVDAAAAGKGQHGNGVGKGEGHGGRRWAGLARGYLKRVL